MKAELHNNIKEEDDVVVMGVQNKTDIFNLKQYKFESCLKKWRWQKSMWLKISKVDKNSAIIVEECDKNSVSKFFSHAWLE